MHSLRDLRRNIHSHKVLQEKAMPDITPKLSKNNYSKNNMNTLPIL